MKALFRMEALQVCVHCRTALLADVPKQPRMALAKFLYYGIERLPSEVAIPFQEASLFDCLLISRARGTVITHRYVRQTSRGGYKHRMVRSVSRGCIVIRSSSDCLVASGVLRHLPVENTEVTWLLAMQKCDGRDPCRFIVPFIIVHE